VVCESVFWGVVPSAGKSSNSSSSSSCAAAGFVACDCLVSEEESDEGWSLLVGGLVCAEPDIVAVDMLRSALSLLCLDEMELVFGEAPHTSRCIVKDA